MTTETHSEVFRDQSLRALKANLANGPYPSYPAERLTYEKGARRIGDYGPLYLPHGPWHMRDNPTKPDYDESARLHAEGYKLDAYSRPLHPWVDAMLSDEDLGVVTGKGFYWGWGPNYTADPIIVRVDQAEPHVLLIKRSDTHQWALPGGFIDPGEDALTAAKREGWEETDLDIRALPSTVTEVYKGPLADIRATANAWPETTAYRFILPLAETRNISLDHYNPSSPEVEEAGWFGASKLYTVLRFGSHALMATTALEQM